VNRAGGGKGVAHAAARTGVTVGDKGGENPGKRSLHRTHKKGGDTVSSLRRKQDPCWGERSFDSGFSTELYASTWRGCSRVRGIEVKADLDLVVNITSFRRFSQIVPVNVEKAS